MKKIFMTIMLGIVMLFTGCDNADGPFESRMEAGQTIIYSNGKPAKGWLSRTAWSQYDQVDVVIMNYYVEDGVPAGDALLYDLFGTPVIEIKGKYKKNGTIFKGSFVSKDGNYMEGEMDGVALRKMIGAYKAGMGEHGTITRHNRIGGILINGEGVTSNMSETGYKRTKYKVKDGVGTVVEVYE